MNADGSNIIQLTETEINEQFTVFFTGRNQSPFSAF